MRYAVIELAAEFDESGDVWVTGASHLTSVSLEDDDAICDYMLELVPGGLVRFWDEFPDETSVKATIDHGGLPRFTLVGL